VCAVSSEDGVRLPVQWVGRKLQPGQTAQQRRKDDLPPRPPATDLLDARNPPCDDRPIWDVWLSLLWLSAVTVADELEIFESLAREPATPTELAVRHGFDLRGIEILRAVWNGITRPPGSDLLGIDTLTRTSH
jgi:hypothetical protein